MVVFVFVLAGEPIAIVPSKSDGNGSVAGGHDLTAEGRASLTRGGRVIVLAGGHTSYGPGTVCSCCMLPMRELTAVEKAIQV